MPLLLRTVRQNRWYKDGAAAFLESDDVPADPLGDLATASNELSVWEVAADRSNLERIVRAVVLTKDKVAVQGYVLFDSALLAEAGFTPVKAKLGKTPDEAANVWHRDLTDLSGKRLVALARLILLHGESGAVLKKRLLQLIESGIAANEVPEKCRKLVSEPDKLSPPTGP